MTVLHLQRFGQPKNIESILDWENDVDNDDVEDTDTDDSDVDNDTEDTDNDAKVTTIDDLLVSDEDDEDYEEPIADDFCEDFIGR
jgi:hypothetical protein